MIDRPKELIPLRGVALTERCGYCEELAESKCVRCARPLCKSHAADRCADCEAEGEKHLAKISNVPIGQGALAALKMVAMAGLGSGVFFGFISLVVLSLIAIFSSLTAAQAIAYSASVFAVFGAMGALVMTAVSIPLLGLGGSLALAQRIRRGFERLRFLRERPGHRRLPKAAKSAIGDEEE